MADEYEQRNMESTVYVISNITGNPYCFKVPSQRGALTKNWTQVQREQRGKGLIIPGNDLRARLTAPKNSLADYLKERSH